MKYEIAPLMRGRETATFKVGSETVTLSANDLMQVLHDLPGMPGKMLP